MADDKKKPKQPTKPPKEKPTVKPTIIREDKKKVERR